MNNHKRVKDTASIVREIYQEHKDWNAKQIYDRYLVLLGDPDKAVTLNAVQKHVQDLKGITGTEEFKSMEVPWNLGLLDSKGWEKYRNEFTSEGLFQISMVQRFCETLKRNPDPPFGEYSALTFGCALWIARLHRFTPYFMTQWKTDKKVHKWKVGHWCVLQLYRWAVAYRFYQEACILARETFNTTELDIQICNNTVPLITRGVEYMGESLTEIGGVSIFGFGRAGETMSFITPDKDYLDKVAKINEKDGEA